MQYRKEKEADGRSPPRDPLSEHLRGLQTAWTSAVLQDQRLAKTWLEHPLRTSHPLIQVLSSWAEPEDQRKWSGPLPVLPLGKLCQFALLQGEKGEALGQALFPLMQFPTLWCPEHQHCEEETKNSIALLLRAFDEKLTLGSFADPYFAALAKLRVSWRRDSNPAPPYGATLFHGDNFSAVLATLGENVPLGALNVSGKTTGIEIPAFGPQSPPLSDPARFGISRIPGEGRWGRVSSIPDIWFETEWIEKNTLKTRFYGLTEDTPLAFAFYIRGAEQAEVEEKKWLPQSLQRYVGKAQKTSFHTPQTTLAVEAFGSRHMELIPLAGKNCFWNAHFLLAYFLSPQGTCQFQFSIS